MEVEEHFPEFRRDDAYHWKKWKLYPGAMFLLVPKLLFLVFMLIVNYVLLSLALLCHDKNKPLVGNRKRIINMIFYVCWRLIAVVVFFQWNTYQYITEN